MTTIFIGRWYHSSEVGTVTQGTGSGSVNAIRQVVADGKYVSRGPTESPAMIAALTTDTSASTNTVYKAIPAKMNQVDQW